MVPRKALLSSGGGVGKWLALSLWSATGRNMISHQLCSARFTGGLIYGFLPHLSHIPDQITSTLAGYIIVECVVGC